jgi:hypothetical protein
VFASHAAAIVVPPGLKPGDTYRLIFVTNGTVEALSPELAYYNSFISNEVLATPALGASALAFGAIPARLTRLTMTGRNQIPAKEVLRNSSMPFPGYSRSLSGNRRCWFWREARF